MGIYGSRAGADYPATGRSLDDAPTQILPAVSTVSATDSGASAKLAQSSIAMAAGTLASRITGFIRTLVLVVALGTHALGDAFNTANTIPNIVYDTLLGGVLTAAHIPLLVRARERSVKYGEEFEQRLFSVLVTALAVITLGAMAVGPFLIRLYGAGFTPAQQKLATTFVLFFLPQIFFYGFSAVASASLNSRNQFAAPMWSPVLNNIVVILVGITFALVTRHPVTPDNISDKEITLIALGTTIGVVLQAVALIPSLRRAGLSWRMRFDFQSGELRSMVNVAGWTVALVVAQQIGLLFFTNIANSAGARGIREGIRVGVGLTPWANAYQFFQVPFAIVAVSVITALFPKMSASAARREYGAVADNLSTSLRVSLMMVIPSATFLFGFSSDICIVFFAHGSTRSGDALVIASILQVFAIALIPFTAHQLLIRGFYALADTRTPAVIGMITTLISIGLALIIYAVVPTRFVVLGIAYSQGIAWGLASAATAALLRRRLGTLRGRRTLPPILKVTAVSVVPPLLAIVLDHLLAARTVQSSTPSLAALLIGGPLSAALVVLGMRLLKISDIDTISRMVRRKPLG